jgi:hypothetical protein
MAAAPAADGSSSSGGGFWSWLSGSEEQKVSASAISGLSFAPSWTNQPNFCATAWLAGFTLIVCLLLTSTVVGGDAACFELVAQGGGTSCACTTNAHPAWS